MTRQKTAAELTSRDIGYIASFRYRRLAVTGVLMRVDPETAIEHDGTGTESNVLLGPVSVVIGDGWTITVAVPLPPDHPVLLEELR